MARSARFAWWLLILLFSLLILNNIITFIVLFTREDRPSLLDANARYQLDFQTRYVLSIAGSPTLRIGLKSTAENAIGFIREELYGTAAEWEARLYVALLGQLAGVGDPAATLKGLSDAPSMELEAHQRRWYAPLWKKALLEPLDGGEVVRLRKVLASSAPPLALQVAESLMWKRAGDTARAQRLLDQLGFSSQLRLSVLGAAGCCGLLWAITGLGLLLWYLVQSFPLAERPLPTA
ncbi:MAG: hypothetical protein NZL85_10835, partial [Fimbriimonadales bacterium]|nr:hypothetical protein [Fimbriimonadales bacterium]